MNKQKLESVMKLHNDNGQTLAQYLGIARPTFSNKLNETRGAEFTQGEIRLIKERYNLSAEEVDMIFFNQKCLKKIQKNKRKGEGCEKETKET